MTRTPRPNALIFAPAAIALALFAAYVFIWFKGAAEMKRVASAWAQEQRANGAVASFENFSVTGFPFFLRGVVTNVALGDGANWTWQAPRIFIDASPFSPDRLVFSARDPHSLDLRDKGRWRVTAPDGRASIERDAERQWLLDIEAGPSRIRRLDRPGAIAAERFLLSVAPNAVDAARVFFGIDVRGVVIENADSSVRIDSVEIALAISGLTRDAKSLRAWRDLGGAVEIQRAKLAADAAHAEVSGILTIDAEGYPAGQLNAEIVNPGPIAVLLNGVGLISRRDADAASAGLTLAAIAGGGKIAAPFRLKDKAASIAGVRLGEAPQIIK